MFFIANENSIVHKKKLKYFLFLQIKLNNKSYITR